MATRYRDKGQYLTRDIQEFLQRYPRQSVCHGGSQNLQFYAGRIALQPDNVTLSHVHTEWRGRFDLLERRHGYIQWLFPIRENSGANHLAQPLGLNEIPELIREHKSKVLRSLEIMLEFYGMRIQERETLELRRTPDYQDRYRNLERNSHNNLRVTRILKCLSELDLEQYNLPILLFFLLEQARGLLKNEHLVSSMDTYWINCVRDEAARQVLREAVERVRQGGTFSVEDYRTMLEHRRQTGIWTVGAGTLDTTKKL